MSQAGIINTTSGGSPPNVPTSFVTDSGTAVPAANILNVFTAESAANFDNGIHDTGSGNTITISLTNRQTGLLTTTDASVQTIITFPLGATPGVYLFDGTVQAYDITDVAGGAYNYATGIRTDGATGTILGTEFKDVFEDLAMSAADFNANVSGNNLIIQVQGLAGKTLHWNAFLSYRFVS